ncbi:adiponectin receptor protein 2-like [Physeter macrocephalus]|uniref:Adiponectin receptor protein 2-like n=1 Tax=Physeter macrocephalus TaxID=9755 RepID=A0A455BEV6_PHYMC|nr:adiponectin receptor protein 2-like [Physeter catodon]|eukprot:XP_028347282.1 adiponectin receptor protein 2-like [Physeter catodon]
MGTGGVPFLVTVRRTFFFLLTKKLMLHPAVKYSVYRITGTVPKFFFLIFTVFLRFPGVFLGLGLSGVIPTFHYVISEGFLKAATIGQIGWLMLMASLYITGAALYAARIPERFFPGKCDIWFHSHQLFHIFVVAGAFVHFHGVSNLQEFRFMIGGGCSEEDAL